MRRSRWLLLLLQACFALLATTTCYATTTTYTFTAPPDDVFVAIGAVGGAQWPPQLIDTQSAFEVNAGVNFENGTNNTFFVDDNALLVSQSSRLNGVFAWADPRSNGADDPFFEVDFTDRVGGVPLEVSYDFAFTIPLDNWGVTVFDTQGDSQFLTGPASRFSFDGGVDNGSEGRAVLTAGGSLDNIARVLFEFGTQIPQNSIQIGLDNLTFDSSSSAADFSGNGIVDGQDLQLWQAAYGVTSNGDANNDGDSDGDDFLIWQQEFSAASPVAALAIPEPSTVTLTSLLMLLVTPTRRVS